MFDPWLKYFKSKLVTKTGGISKSKVELPTGNRMWEIAARSNARPKEVRYKDRFGNVTITGGGVNQ